MHTQKCILQLITSTKNILSSSNIDVLVVGDTNEDVVTLHVDDLDIFPDDVCEQKSDKVDGMAGSSAGSRDNSPECDKGIGMADPTAGVHECPKPKSDLGPSVGPPEKDCAGNTGMADVTAGARAKLPQPVKPQVSQTGSETEKGSLGILVTIAGRKRTVTAAQRRRKGRKYRQRRQETPSAVHVDEVPSSSESDAKSQALPPNDCRRRLNRLDYSSLQTFSGMCVSSLSKNEDLDQGGEGFVVDLSSFV